MNSSRILTRKSSYLKTYIQHNLENYFVIVKTLLRNRDIPIFENETHIVPVRIGDAKKCKAISDELINEYGIYCQAINYPTVDVGTERLRFAPTPFHSNAMMHSLCDALEKVIKYV